MKKLFIVPLFLIALKLAALDGVASHYASKFNGRQTANGEIYRDSKLTAASNFYKLGTIVVVKNTKNGKEVIVKINDRMSPAMAKRGRIVDLSKSAANKLGFSNTLIKVTVQEYEDNKRI